MQFAPDDRLPAQLWADKRPWWVPDVSAEETFTRRMIAKAAGLETALIVPVLADDRALGLLVFLSRGPRRRDPRVIALATAVGAQLGTVAQRKRAEAAFRRS